MLLLLCWFVFLSFSSHLSLSLRSFCWRTLRTMRSNVNCILFAFRIAFERRENQQQKKSQFNRICRRQRGKKIITWNSKHWLACFDSTSKWIELLARVVKFTRQWHLELQLYKVANEKNGTAREKRTRRNSYDNKIIGAVRKRREMRVFVYLYH